MQHKGRQETERYISLKKASLKIEAAEKKSYQMKNLDKTIEGNFISSSLLDYPKIP